MKHSLLLSLPLLFSFFANAQETTGSIPVTTAGGTANKIAKFDGNSDIANSQIFDNGTNVGIGITSPSTKLDVNGGATIRGSLFLPSTGKANQSDGKNSQAFTSSASVFNSSTGTAIAQNFRWQAEPVSNNTPNASGSLNLLFYSGTNSPQETGLHISSAGQITFSAGQGFPGTALLASPNTFTASQTVTGSVSATSFSGDGSALTNLQGANVQGTVASALSASFSTTSGTAGNSLMLGGLPPTAYATAGSLPGIVANVSLLNVQGPVPLTTLVTPTQNATYRVSSTIVGVSGCNVTPPANIDWTWADNGGARAFTANNGGITNGMGTWTFLIRANAGTPLTYQVLDINCTPFELYIIAEQLQ
jgi:hypothetical protein